MPDDIHAHRVQSRQDLSVSQFGTGGLEIDRCLTNFTIPEGTSFLQSTNGLVTDPNATADHYFYQVTPYIP